MNLTWILKLFVSMVLLSFFFRHDTRTEEAGGEVIEFNAYPF